MATTKIKKDQLEEIWQHCIDCKKCRMKLFLINDHRFAEDTTNSSAKARLSSRIDLPGMSTEKGLYVE